MRTPLQELLAQRPEASCGLWIDGVRRDLRRDAVRGEGPRRVVDPGDVVVLQVDASEAGEQRARGREHDGAGALLRGLLAALGIDDGRAGFVQEALGSQRLEARCARDLGGDEADDVGTGTKANTYSRVLQAALFNVKELMQDLVDLELRGRGGVRGAGDLQERARFVQRIGGQKYKIPAVALSHGYQSTIAWIADLVGHVVLEAGGELSPKDMVGLVLVDEIDLYLHPAWQVVLVHALRETFPQMQFVVTTHSPLVLAALNPDEDQVVRLEHDPKTGDVVRVGVDEDPRLLTGTEILRLYFGLEDIHPDGLGRDLQRYHYLAANPYRSDADDLELDKLLAEMRRAGVDPHFEPVQRKPFVRRTG